MTTVKPRIVICDDDESLRLALKGLLTREGFDCQTAHDTDEALAICRNRKVDVLLLDVQLRTHQEGFEAIPKVRALDDEIAIVMVTGLRDFSSVRQALIAGANDYISKDLDPAEIVFSIRRILEKKRLETRKLQQNSEVVSGQRRHVLVGSGEKIQNLRKLLDRIRPSAASVVITGETGSGKEVVARSLRGELADGTLMPFVAVDSSTIHSQTAESILFGHDKGAFTGAEKPRKGIFEEANGGIVYFDEIANMSLEIQAKLLRVIQEKEVTRLGTHRAIPVEFRVIAATNRDLEKMVKEGLFKDDLLQRLNVIPVSIPPLREHPEDIPALVEHFVERNGGDLFFTDAAILVLQEYSWPGNIRELGNVVAYLKTMTDGNEVDVQDLPPRVKETASSRAAATLRAKSFIEVVSAHPETGEPRGFYEQVAEFEKELLRHEYEAVGRNMTQLATRLGMDRSHLYTKFKVYGLQPPASSLAPRERSR